MRSIKNYLESLLDDDDIFYDHENDKKVIEEWIKNNYKIYRKKLTISDDLVVDCVGLVEVKNKSIESLTNGLFRWGNVDGSFDCNGCRDLKSLEGAPESVGDSFDCSDCTKLKSLEGAPKEVGGGFYCSQCNSLTSLKGSPKKVGGYFNCRKCINLKSLEGAPEKIGERLNCRYCDKLKITDSDRKKYKIND